MLQSNSVGDSKHFGLLCSCALLFPGNDSSKPEANMGGNTEISKCLKEHFNWTGLFGGSKTPSSGRDTTEPGRTAH